MLRWLWERLIGRRSYVGLDAFLAVLRARGVLEYQAGRVRVVFRESDETARTVPALDAVATAAQLTAPANERESRPPTDDELLFGQDGYGLGPGKVTD